MAGKAQRLQLPKLCAGNREEPESHARKTALFSEHVTHLRSLVSTLQAARGEGELMGDQPSLKQEALCEGINSD